MAHDDEFDERPNRSRRDDDSDAPSRRRRDDDDYDRGGPPVKSGGIAAIIWVIVGLVVLFVLICGGAVAVGLLLPAVTKVREAANRVNSSNNMKQLAIGGLNYESTNKGLPTNSYDANGKPLLSSRVHLLPYVEQEGLYRQFKLDQPWDSPANKPLLNQIPPIYVSVNRPPAPNGMTYYRGFTQQGAIFEKRPQANGRIENPIGPTLRNVADGQPNTFFIVEASVAVEWTKPDDFDGGLGKPFPGLGDPQLNNAPFLAVFCDGSVKAIKRTIPEMMLRNASTYAGGEAVSLE